MPKSMYKKKKMKYNKGGDAKLMKDYSKSYKEQMKVKKEKTFYAPDERKATKKPTQLYPDTATSYLHEKAANEKKGK